MLRVMSEPVAAVIRYLGVMTERPYFLAYESPPGVPTRNTRGNRQTVVIRDARDLEPPPTLDREGFGLVAHRTDARDLRDEPAIRAVYYPEMERLVRAHTGAARVVAFDHNLRSATATERQTGVQAPVRYPHNDYTERSAPQRVRDLLPAEADRLLQRRFAVINTWKPIRGPVLDAPLAFCDAGSIAPSDFVATDLRYRDRAGEIYSLRFNAAHRWFYYSAMSADEVLLLKCFDADAAHASFTAHSAFDHPDAPAGTPPRESIEVRTLAFF
jgi:hypothetical protein